MSKDTIYREDAIEALNECTDIKGFKYTQMHNALIEIPSADRPQGEWVEMYRDGFGNMICMCSKCNFHVPRSRYCPNCGTRMKGADDETDRR